MVAKEPLAIDGRLPIFPLGASFNKTSIGHAKAGKSRVFKKTHQKGIRELSQ